MKVGDYSMYLNIRDYPRQTFNGRKGAFGEKGNKVKVERIFGGKGDEGKGKGRTEKKVGQIREWVGNVSFRKGAFGEKGKKVKVERIFGGKGDEGKDGEDRKKVWQKREWVGNVSFRKRKKIKT